MADYLRKNFLVIISAPSGGGKTTICQAILRILPDIDYSVSFTTRQPRKNEVEGISYFFVSKEEFNKKIADNDLLEYAEVHNNMYGTSRSFINERFANNRNVILDIDVQGADKIIKSGIDCVTIFLLPPETTTLKERLIKRDTDSMETIQLRISNAVKEIKELKNYQYLVINDDLDKTIEEVRSIIIAEQNRVCRYQNPEQIFYGG